MIHTLLLGVGDVLIRFIFGREVTLNYMLHAPEIHKNLIYGYFFNKAHFKPIIKFNQYACDEMFKLNI